MAFFNRIVSLTLTKQIIYQNRTADVQAPMTSMLNAIRCMSSKHFTEGFSSDTALSAQDIAEVENIISYTFRKKNFLEDALTGKAISLSDLTREVVAVLGDSCINYICTKDSLLENPGISVGMLSQVRAANVNNERLARQAIKHNLQKYIRPVTPVLLIQIKEFMNDILQYPSYSYGLVKFPKELADVVESVVGAVHLDCNEMHTTYEVAMGLLMPLITPNTLESHPMKLLTELCRKNKLTLKCIDLWSKEGKFEIYINNELKGSCTYLDKKEVAMTRAANEACQNYGRGLKHHKPKRARKATQRASLARLEEDKEQD